MLVHYSDEQTQEIQQMIATFLKTKFITLKKKLADSPF